MLDNNYNETRRINVTESYLNTYFLHILLKYLLRYTHSNHIKIPNVVLKHTVFVHISM